MEDLSMRFLVWIPLTTPTPIRSFPRRLIKKWRFIIGNLVGTIEVKFNLVGARVVGETSSGSTLLRLNRDYALGRKGTELEIPQDKVIFESVKRRGSWELEESEFLAFGLRKVGKIQNLKVALLDIGANTGLVTLQAMNLSKTNIEVFLFEPIPRHVAAIKHNLRDFSKIYINEFALSDVNGTSEIFTQTSNHGNTSLLKSVVPIDEQICTQIRLVDVGEYCDNCLKGFDIYAVKCDTQGMDALILSRIPGAIWQNTEVAVIEVWALSEVSEQDVTHLLTMFQNFEYFSWNPISQDIKSLSEISEFWLSKSGTSRNLFLSKTHHS